MTGDLIHAGVVVVVIICASALVAVHVVTGHDAIPVFGAAVGYAAGRSGTISGGQP